LTFLDTATNSDGASQVVSEERPKKRMKKKFATVYYPYSAAEQATPRTTEQVKKYSILLIE
jgi:hypothetical protein